MRILPNGAITVGRRADSFAPAADISSRRTGRSLIFRALRRAAARCGFPPADVARSRADLVLARRHRPPTSRQDFGDGRGGNASSRPRRRRRGRMGRVASPRLRAVRVDDPRSEAGADLTLAGGWVATASRVDGLPVEINGRTSRGAGSRSVARLSGEPGRSIERVGGAAARILGLGSRRAARTPGAGCIARPR